MPGLSEVKTQGVLALQSLGPLFQFSERPDMARWSSIDHMKPKSGA